MSEDEIEAAARSDADNPPLSAEDLRAMRRVPRIKTLRRALSLTQEEFSARYFIPLGTLRDWEQGRSEPDQTARAYLIVIAHNPLGIATALKAPLAAPQDETAGSNQPRTKHHDSRIRDHNGEIHRKHSNTLVKTLRATYGDDFAKGVRGDIKLGTLLKQEGIETLDQYLKHKR